MKDDDSPPEFENIDRKKRRSSLQKETDAIADLVRLLKPFTHAQRKRLIEISALMMQEESQVEG